MSCSKCNKNNTNCGCTDTPYTTSNSGNCSTDVSCPTPSKCAEYYDSACTVYAGAGIWELGINSGRSLQSIIQQLIIRTGDTPDCADPCSTCQSTWNLYLAKATNSALVIGWEPSATANSYQVEYQQVPSNPCTLGSWTLLPSQTTLTATISNLTANTEYLVRVRSTCTSGNCYSVIIKVKTLA